MPAELVIPISLCERRGQFHYILRMYKDGVADLRERFLPVIAATLAHFLARHRPCIHAAAGVDWNIVTTVPSSRSRTPPHPLERAVQMVVGLADDYRALLAPGPNPASHNQAHDDAYRVTEDVHGARVLLIDDTFTTGASVQSAASALQLAGARVTAIVPVGRYVNPAFNDESRDLWGRAKAIPFTFDSCCVEVPF